MTFDEGSRYPRRTVDILGKGCPLIQVLDQLNRDTLIHVIDVGRKSKSGLIVEEEEEGQWSKLIFWRSIIVFLLKLCEMLLANRLKVLDLE